MHNLQRKVDLHLHSHYSWDSSVAIEEYIRQAESLDFTAIAITDHNNTESHHDIMKLQETTEVVLIPGQEVSTRDGHLLVYGWVKRLEPGLPMSATIDQAHLQAGICIAAHPFDPFRGGSFGKIFETHVDGFEILNASAWFSFPNWLAKRAHAHHNQLAAVGNSDSHRLDEFGTAYTVLTLPHDVSLENLLSHLQHTDVGGRRIGIYRKLIRLFHRKIH